MAVSETSKKLTQRVSGIVGMLFFCAILATCVRTEGSLLLWTNIYDRSTDI